MKNLLLVLFPFLFLSCNTAENVIVSSIKNNQKSIIAFMDVGENKKNYNVIEVNIPLAFSIENKSNKEVSIVSAVDFSSAIWKDNIKGGLNSSIYYNGKKIKELLPILPNEKKDILLYYKISVLNSKENSCLFEKLSAKEKETLFIDGKDECLSDYIGYIKSQTNSTFYYENNKIIIPNK
ncbi:hypothetical protein [Chryseobacterium sp. CT-SW4]|uniref:hypothetical protein n=1 Tax=Chryseobacterium sp. SW-1 TaxID=3157343 RepID=UPI003B028E62